jgi:hypothetical protein
MKWYVLAAIGACACAAAFAADDPPPGFKLTAPSSTIIASIRPTHMVFQGQDGKPRIDVNLDTGEVKHEGYDPDEAARSFWEAVGRLRSQDCLR